MRRPTLQMAIDSGVGQPVGVCKQDLAENAAIVNLAEEQLMIDPLAPDEGWFGGWAKMVFNVTSTLGSSFFVTPFNIARVIVLDVCKNPIPLRNGCHENLDVAIGLEPNACNPEFCQTTTIQAFERDSVSTLADFPPTPQYLRFFPTDNSDLGRRIVPQGNDQNGIPITNLDIDTQTTALGEVIFLQAPFSASINQFSNITGILKEITLGRVKVFTVDPNTGDSVYLTTMEPNETTASYRRYFVNGLPCNCCSTPGGIVQITAQCKLDWIPVAAPSDYLNIPNIPALIQEVQSMRYAKMDSASAAALESKHHAKAIALLNGQLDVYQGKINTAIRVPLFGSDKLKPMPI